MDGLLADLRLALRGFRRNRTLSLSIVTTLGLAIGAGVATFAVAEAALITPPPFPEPDRLALVYTTHTEPTRGTERYRWSYPRFRMLERALTTTVAVGSYGPASVNLAGSTDAEPIRAEVVSGGYFAALGARPSRGRLFSVEEDAATASSAVALLAHELWTRRYGGDLSLIGQSIRVNGQDLTV